MNYAQAFFFYTAALKIADALTVIGVWYACWYLRFDSTLFPITKGLPEFQDYSSVSLPLAIVFSAVFHMVGTYRRDRIHFGFRALKKIVEGSLLAMLVFISICYFLQKLNFSRLYLVIFPILIIFFLVAERAILQGLWRLAEHRLIRRFRILLIGHGTLLHMYVDKLHSRKPYPIEWIGRLGEADPTFSDCQFLPHLGRVEDLSAVLGQQAVDYVVVSCPTDVATLYPDLLERLSNELVVVKLLPDFGRYSTFTYSADQELGIPILVFNQGPTGTTDLALKRAFDILFSLAFFTVFSPLYAMIGLIVKATSRGPIFYSQERVGADGHIFRVYKFRTMRTDAEVQTGPIWARRDDGRTTAFGQWLRRSSLDEIPQFFNILRGDMSIVGPRPERPMFVKQFRQEIPKYMLRHKMKSGITGWAQVNGWRGNTSLEERIKHDLYYIGHWSHLFDIKIICLTPLTVLKGFLERHAY